MRISITGPLAAALLLVMAVLAVPIVQSQDINGEIELLRADVRSQKLVILTREMQLTEAQSAVFWPLQRKYQNDVDSIFEEKVGLLREYATNPDKIDDAKAGELMERAIQIDEKVHALMRKHATAMKAVLPGKLVARFFQLERRLIRLIDLQLSTQVPLVNSQ